MSLFALPFFFASSSFRVFVIHALGFFFLSTKWSHEIIHSAGCRYASKPSSLAGLVLVIMVISSSEIPHLDRTAQ